jgi:hypothetical protein
MQPFVSWIQDLMTCLSFADIPNGSSSWVKEISVVNPSRTSEIEDHRQTILLEKDTLPVLPICSPNLALGLIPLP